MQPFRHPKHTSLYVCIPVLPVCALLCECFRCRKTPIMIFCVRRVADFISFQSVHCFCRSIFHFDFVYRCSWSAYCFRREVFMFFLPSMSMKMSVFLFVCNICTSIIRVCRRPNTEYLLFCLIFASRLLFEVKKTTEWMNNGYAYFTRKRGNCNKWNIKIFYRYHPFVFLFRLTSTFRNWKPEM